MNEKIMELVNTTLAVKIINTLNYVEDFELIRNQLEKPRFNLYQRGSLTPLLSNSVDYILYSPSGLPVLNIKSIDNILETVKDSDYALAIPPIVTSEYYLNDIEPELVMDNRLLTSGNLVPYNNNHVEIETIQNYIIDYMENNCKHTVLAPASARFTHLKNHNEDNSDTQVIYDLYKDLYRLGCELDDIIESYPENFISIELNGCYVTIRVLPDYRIFSYEDAVMRKEMEYA